MTIRIGTVLLMLSVSAASAQQRALERIDSLIAAGRAQDARAALKEWERTSAADARTDAAQRSRGLYLSARLTEDAGQAQEKYLNVALSYPTAREAPDALLRLGQGLLATGDAQRAATYFERLIRDYPKASARPAAYLWLMRAQISAGNARAACSTAGAIKPADLTADVRDLIANEQKTACSPPAEHKASNTAPVVTPPPALPVSAGAPDAHFAVQIAAFRDAGNATSIAAQLKRSGFDVRVVYIEGNSLARVRIGRFKTNAEAASELKRAQSAGLTGIIVDDVQKEKNETH